MRKLLKLLTVIIFAWLLGSAPAFSCMCLCEGSIDKTMLINDIVFAGLVTQSKSESMWRGEFEFEVNEIWKGDLGQTVTVSSSKSSCGRGFSEGSQYVVFAKKHQKKFQTGICRGPCAFVNAKNTADEISILSKRYNSWTPYESRWLPNPKAVVWHKILFMISSLLFLIYVIRFIWISMKKTEK